MIFDFYKLVEKHDLDIKGVVHVGAHECGEILLYSTLGIKDAILIEANPDRFNNLTKTIKEGRYNTWCSPLTYSQLPEDLSSITSHYKVLNLAITDYNGEADLNISTHDGGADSLYKITKEGTDDSWCKYTHCGSVKVKCATLDSLDIPKHFNFLNVDIEGAELECFRGADKLLNQIDYILCEVQEVKRFENSCLESELIEFLGSRGFRKVDYIAGTSKWGDSLFSSK